MFISPSSARLAFSLVELAIVLVILGLLVGGALSGKALIKAAELRSQINQIQEFSVATKTFKDKYFYWPGDLPEPIATQAGFKARGALGGQGDGNGIIEGWRGGAIPVAQYYGTGENLLFWTDLSKAALINGNFTTAVANVQLPTTTDKNTIGNYFPKGKLGSNSVFVIGGSQGADGGFIKNGKSYLALQNISQINVDYINRSAADYGLTVSDAYTIDTKMDDGSPLSGKIGALFIHMWTIASNPFAAGAVPASATTCLDNQNNASNPFNYSASVNNGEGKNCSLFFDVIN
jgi:type II secretory pathway pseudopilin PulG